jgi:methionyl-tRNA formyltransferase
MSEALDMANLPMKVVIFAADQMAIPTINMLLQQQRLAGVVLAEQPDMFSQQLQGWLQQQHIPCARYLQEQPTTISTQLACWEADLAISFGFGPTLPDTIIDKLNYGLYYFHEASPSQYNGQAPLYWQIRQGASQTQLTLQKATAQSDNIAATFDMPIQPLDTLQCLQNNVAQQVPVLINQFIEQLIENQGQVAFTTSKGKAEAAQCPTENQLYVDWSKMTSAGIVAMAKAGNPNFGGCIVVLGKTPLSLLQATVSKHPTFGVEPGTLCHTGEPEGVIVATCDGAVRLDILSNADGIFSAINFIERFQINAGMAFEPSPSIK